MKDFLKQYWYVAIVSVVFVVGIIAVILNSAAGQVSTKQVDGKDVLYSIDGYNRTADEFYEMVGENSEAQLASLIFEKEVIEHDATHTEDQKVEAKLQADQVIASYKAAVGTEKADILLKNTMLGLGYSEKDTIEEYFLDQYAIEAMIADYFSENYEEEVKKEEPLIVSHILLQPSTDPNLSDEQKEADLQKRMEEVETALETQPFANVAAQYSQDPGSAQNGGSLGVVYKTINFHPEFLDATYKLKLNEPGDWIESPSGWHKIMVTENDFDKIKNTREFQSFLQTKYPQLRGEAFFAKAEELNLDFSMNPEFEQKLRAYYGLTGGQE